MIKHIRPRVLDAGTISIATDASGTPLLRVSLETTEAGKPALESIHASLGAEFSELPIGLLSDDVDEVLVAGYRRYSPQGKPIAKCDGDSCSWFVTKTGEALATPRLTKCDGEHFTAGWQTYGALHCILAIPESTWGIYRLSLVGRDVIERLYGSLVHIQQLTFGRLRGLALRLTLRPAGLVVELTGRNLLEVQTHACALPAPANAKSGRDGRAEYLRQLLELRTKPVVTAPPAAAPSQAPAKPPPNEPVPEAPFDEEDLRPSGPPTSAATDALIPLDEGGPGSIAGGARPAVRTPHPPTTADAIGSGSVNLGPPQPAEDILDHAADWAAKQKCSTCGAVGIHVCPPLTAEALQKAGKAPAPTPPYDPLSGEGHPLNPMLGDPYDHGARTMAGDPAPYTGTQSPAAVFGGPPPPAAGPAPKALSIDIAAGGPLDSADKPAAYRYEGMTSNAACKEHPHRWVPRGEPPDTTEICANHCGAWRVPNPAAPPPAAGPAPAAPPPAPAPTPAVDPPPIAEPWTPEKVDAAMEAAQTPAEVEAAVAHCDPAWSKELRAGREFVHGRALKRIKKAKREAANTQAPAPEPNPAPPKGNLAAALAGPAVTKALAPQALDAKAVEKLIVAARTDADLAAAEAKIDLLFGDQSGFKDFLRNVVGQQCEVHGLRRAQTAGSTPSAPVTAPAKPAEPPPNDAVDREVENRHIEELFADLGKAENSGAPLLEIDRVISRCIKLEHAKRIGASASADFQGEAASLKHEIAAETGAT